MLQESYPKTMRVIQKEPRFPQWGAQALPNRQPTQNQKVGSKLGKKNDDVPFPQNLLHHVQLEDRVPAGALGVHGSGVHHLEYFGNWGAERVSLQPGES